jgi:hypothetical protein
MPDTNSLLSLRRYIILVILVTVVMIIIIIIVANFNLGVNFELYTSPKFPIYFDDIGIQDRDSRSTKCWFSLNRKRTDRMRSPKCIYSPYKFQILHARKKFR